ncbi:DUF72 domain-containing protein [Coleofasciculus sp. FACHB-64]|uniref:DUF72 domain-containing protein n=1 Tax=Cyanophyceae TaxID=3028117 RepID=UPI0016854D65|nr:MULTISPECIES: DUF72 domain-containing protein [unclassified Coleofasciculus]MBD1838641.1 DUF72 domain-containing protein [Coleofasciculus sp. FACHB-501]MBD2045876.1 DUF72 domain-containing protein [Coleofasciculus sp. FACHB-64]MBD2086279.1 DUF72 domain-containing protein [Coleofasciculus sp. FACHB-542]
MSFLLGCAVWGYKGWIGDLFPPGSRSKDFLRLYSQRFTAVEGNTTFYAVPDADTVARWAQETPAGFKFCLKLPRTVTHNGLLQPSIPGALKFLEQMQGLGVGAASPEESRLGPIFAQLPPNYPPAYLDDLTAFLEAWPRNEAPLALEVRHSDWFKEPHSSHLTALLQQLGVGRVLLDTRPVYTGSANSQECPESRKPNVPVQPIVTASFSLIRFISHPEQSVNQPFMEEWVSLLDGWLRQGTKIYFFMHCPLEERSPGNARHFQQLLEQHNAPVPPLPWNGIEVPPTQLSLF